MPQVSLRAAPTSYWIGMAAVWETNHLQTAWHRLSACVVPSGACPIDSDQGVDCNGIPRKLQKQAPHWKPLGKAVIDYHSGPKRPDKHMHLTFWFQGPT